MTATFLAVSLFTLIFQTPSVFAESHHSIVQTETAESHIEKAREAINNQRWEAAKSELKRAIKLKQDSAIAHLLLAGVYRREGIHGEAIKSAKNAIKFQPDYIQAYPLLASLLLEANDLKAAQQIIDAGLGQNSQYPPLHVLKGDLELAISKPAKGLKAYDPTLDSAIKSYEEALRLASPNDTSLPILRERIAGLKNYIELIHHEDDASYVKAKPLNTPELNYPAEARRAGVHGMIKLGLIINEQGVVTAAQLFSHLGYGMDEEAVNAALKVKFSPAMIAGKPISSWSRMEVEFHVR